MERTGRKGVEYRWIRRDEKKRSVEGGVERHERRADDGKGTPAHSSTRSSAMAKEDSTRIPVNLHPAGGFASSSGPRALSCPCFLLDTDDVLTCTTKHADLIKADSVKRIRGHFEDLLRERGEGSARRSATLPCHLHYSPTKGSKASEVWFGSNQRPKKRFGIQRFRAAAKIVTAAQKMETVEMKERRQNGISTKTILLLEKIKKRNADVRSSSGGLC
eukprot:757771-Hanusia_phi.AAC.3